MRKANEVDTSNLTESSELTVSVIAAVLDVSGERVRQFLAAGYFSRESSGKIKLGNAVRGYVLFLRGCCANCPALRHVGDDD